MIRTKNFLFFSFLFVVAVPFLIFGTWSYYTSLQREIERAQERHLLLARNLGESLNRYTQDLIGSLEIIFRSLSAHVRPDNLHTLLATLDIKNSFVLNESNGTIVQLGDIDPSILKIATTANIIRFALVHARADKIIFSKVVEIENENVILAMRRYGNNLAVAIIATDYFIEIGKSISFGNQGYAILFDNVGNILYHPNSVWIKQRKNLGALEIVQNMISGKTGIGYFHSPYLEKKMIAAIANVPLVNWGVMVLQPVDELYAQIGTHNSALLLALGVGGLLSFILIMAFVNSLTRPFDMFLATMRRQARRQELESINIQKGIISLREVHEIGVSYNSLVKQICEAKEKIEKIAFHDGLTGLPNRGYLLKLAQEILLKCQLQKNNYKKNNCQKNNCDGGLFIFIDLDDFKTINDTHGHALGDAFLCDVSQVLLKIVKKTSILYGLSRQNIPAPIVARIGGDEFACLLPGLVEEIDVYNFLQDLQQQLSKPCLSLPFSPKYRASIGAARYPVDTNRLEELLKFSDIAMYNAKRSGKGCFQIYSPKIGEKTLSQIVGSVERALKLGHFNLSYVPIFYAGSEKIKMYDVVVNWHDPISGLVEKSQWQNALIAKPLAWYVIDWIFTTSLANKAKHKDMILCYDLSLPFLKTFDCISILSQKIRAHGFENKDFILTFTQSSILENSLLDNEKLYSYHLSGFRLALAGLGRGYFDFSKFAKLPISYISFHNSLTSLAHSNENMAIILCNLIDMAKELNFKTIARKVENSNQVNFLSSSGIDYLSTRKLAKNKSI